MAIGNQISAGSINSQAGALAVRWQQLGSDMQQFTSATGGLNSAALQALGFSSGDAALMVSVIASMTTYAGVYYGLAAQPSPFSYDASFLQLRGTA